MYILKIIITNSQQANSNQPIKKQSNGKKIQIVAMFFLQMYYNSTSSPNLYQIIVLYFLFWMAFSLPVLLMLSIFDVGVACWWWCWMSKLVPFFVDPNIETIVGIHPTWLLERLKAFMKSSSIQFRNLKYELR
jgi:hypothetical protein